MKTFPRCYDRVLPLAPPLNARTHAEAVDAAGRRYNRRSMPPTYVRFVTMRLDPDSHTRQGVFQAAAALVDANELSDEELEELQQARRWFHDHLDAPDRFARSRKRRAAPKAISWFKSTATEYVSRMHALCAILNRHGVRTELITSTRPGYIVFEDDHQIAAEPFTETKT